MMEIVQLNLLDGRAVISAAVSDYAEACRIWAFMQAAKLALQNQIKWIKIGPTRLPSEGENVWLFDKHASEPVWPGAIVDGVWHYIDGAKATPTHYAELPLAGPL